MRFPRLGTLIAAALLSSIPTAAATAQDEFYNPYGTWNLYRIYLSPARHPDSGSRGECRGYDENTLTYWNTYDATNGDYYSDVYDPTSTGRNLRARGYTVRIGRTTYEAAIVNSNNWGADLHIVMHSNAPGGTHTCTSQDSTSWGTNVIYRVGSTGGQSLADLLRGNIGPSSPGRRDYICYNPNDPSGCTDKDLAELRETIAVAAYSESEFHTWNVGVDWLFASWIWAWRVGVAVDQQLGYPR
jgi:hypothetical protein